MQKREQKVKLRNVLLLYFDSILQVFSSKCFDFVHQCRFFLFCCKVFWFFFFELSIFQNSFKFSNNGIKYFTAECFFLVPITLKSPQNCSLDQLESHKRYLFHQKSNCEMAALSPFLSVFVFYLISFSV